MRSSFGSSGDDQEDPPKKRKASTRPKGLSESEALSQIVTIGGRKYQKYTGNIFAEVATSDDGEIYKCPKGDTIGLNLLSEPYVADNPLIKDFDFFASRQKLGVKRGLLRPEPIYFCSPAFRKMIEEEKLSGFEFEITNIE